MVTAAERKLKGRYVRFLVRHIHLPESASVLHQLHDDEQLRGKVVMLSDSAQGTRTFVGVRVPRVRETCFVPIDRLLRKKRKKKPEAP